MYWDCSSSLGFHFDSFSNWAIPALLNYIPWEVSLSRTSCHPDRSFSRSVNLRTLSQRCKISPSSSNRNNSSSSWKREFSLPEPELNGSSSSSWGATTGMTSWKRSDRVLVYRKAPIFGWLWLSWTLKCRLQTSSCPTTKFWFTLSDLRHRPESETSSQAFDSCNDLAIFR